MCNKLLCLLMLVFVIGGVAIVKADPNLVAWYKFDETSGANVTDSSGNGFHTSINGTVSYGWDSDGAVNGCLNNHFANRNVYIPVPMGVFSAMDKQATFTFWAQLTELSSSGLYTGGWFTGTDPNSDKLAWARAYQFDDYTRFSAVYNLGTTSQDEWWSAYYPDTEGVNEWHHFAMVFDEIAETKKLYFDGQLITSASRDIEEGDSIADMNAFNIFHATSTGAGYWDSFHGKMDDFRIYDKALSAQEVAMFSGGYFEVAKTPYPADGASIELGSPDALTMEWVAGLFAASHNVYLGTNFNDVNDANTLSAEFMGNRVAAAYTPSFPSDGTYYWRIDEVNDVNVWKGDVWSFEVEITADPNLVAWYKFDETSGANVTDSSGNGFHTSINGTVSYGWDSDGAVNGCLNNHFANRNVYIPVPIGVFSAMDQQGTFTFWAQLTELSSSGLYTGGWFTGTDPNNDKLAWARAYQLDDYTRFAAIYNLGTTSQDEWWYIYNDSTTADEWHHFAMVFDEIAGTKKLYFDGYLITNESSDIEEGDSIADMNAFNIFHATSTGSGYWDSFHGKMDDFRIYDRALSESEIERLSTPVTASQLMPADGQIAEANENSDLTLYWKSGLDAADVNGHHVYFGEDYNSVNNATLISDEYQGTQTANSYDLYSLSDVNTYYWRIDEVNGVALWKGDTCSFTINHNITFFITSDIHYGRYQTRDNEQNNKELIAQMNYMPGKIHYPASLGGELVQRPRALLVSGDLTDYGEANEWEGYDEYDGFVDDFCGVLNYQLYEGYGNHDSGLTGTDDYSKQQVRIRNLTRPGISNLSTNDYHYSWDWNNVHFVNLNLYPGPQGGRWAEAEGSIDFLISDLADNVGTSDNPVVIYHHFGMDDRALTWWDPADANTYYDSIENYNVIAIFHGHSHDANVYQWNGIDVYDVGTATTGEFAVVNITDDELIFASMDKSGWQILDTKSFSVNPITVLTYDDFESDTGNYTIGGGDCSRYTGGTYAYKNSCAMNIQDNSGTSSSFYHTTGIDVRSYSEINVTFSFYGVGMNTGHDFWVEYFDGNDWNTVATYVCGTDFSNGSFYTDTVTIDSGTYDFPIDMKIRFQCSAGNNYDDVYIDDITVIGK